nr:hypothetical protein Iba_chr06cCG12110 [Ipomoea batatas]
MLRRRRDERACRECPVVQVCAVCRVGAGGSVAAKENPFFSVLLSLFLARSVLDDTPSGCGFTAVGVGVASNRANGDGDRMAGGSSMLASLLGSGVHSSDGSLEVPGEVTAAELLGGMPLSVATQGSS